MQPLQAMKGAVEWQGGLGVLGDQGVLRAGGAGSKSSATTVRNPCLGSALSEIQAMPCLQDDVQQG